MLRIQKVTKISSDGLHDWNFQLHSHKDMIELSLILDGEEQIFYDGCSYIARKGDLFIKNAGILHSESSRVGESLQMICISFSGVTQPELPPETLRFQNGCPVKSTEEMFPLLEQLFRFLETLTLNKPEDYIALCSELLNTVLTLTLRLLSGYSLQAASTEPDIHQVIPDICRYLDACYNQNITLEGLGKMFHFSSYYLARRFKLETGLTINQYLVQLRIGEAQRLLCFEDLPIKEIAANCGFPNLQHFYATFKRHTGFTPVEFRTQYRVCSHE